MKIFKYLTAVLLTTFISFSCNEDEWLRERAYDFYTSDNSYVTAEQFNSAVARLYQLTQDYTILGGIPNFFLYTHVSDVGYQALSTTHELNSMSDALTPSNVRVNQNWQRFYLIIANANTIISRIDLEGTEFDSEEQRNTLKAEAKFFRANAYMLLAHIYGGVPLVVEEVTEAKRDFVRASRQETYTQAISDAEFAAAHLPSADNVAQDGRISYAAANHLLAELYISVGDYDAAIAKATEVIDDPNFELMTTRFGSRMNEPGDVYWDLFRRDNQNRATHGNKEAIWIAQFEYNVTGGGRGWNLPQFGVCSYHDLRDVDDVLLFGHGYSQYGGRGIGWWQPSDYVHTTIWENAENDIRTSEHNILRDIVAMNPESRFYGEKIVESGAIDGVPNPLDRHWNPIFAKKAPINNHPDDMYVNRETGQLFNNPTLTFTDGYLMRLAETYLLRAEAYLMKGDVANAAADINIVRARANATPVAVEDVDIDYLLDERARELAFEEFRMITLMRMGKLAERLRTYNPFYNGKYATNTVEDYHNTWPIPFSEIERNSEAPLEQNPGYN